MTVLQSIGTLPMLIGGTFVLIGGIGVVRLPDFYTRIHAAGVTEVLGMILMLAGIMLWLGPSLDAAKVAAVMAFLLLSGPTSAYALANAAWLSGVKPKLHREGRDASD
jgi:multicomponent Na+:H+ antiporter subunit G